LRDELLYTTEKAKTKINWKQIYNLQNVGGCFDGGVGQDLRKSFKEGKILNTATTKSTGIKVRQNQQVLMKLL
jgi:hypothetical protein